ncbi:MAG TPA: CcmD family protein [candidate division Zixibacteria bacterium]
MSSNYVPMIVTLVIWVGLFLYLFKLDCKIKRMTKK